MTLVVCAPLAGRVIDLSVVPDPVFAGGMVGPGRAIVPTPDAGPVVAAAPVAGRIVKAHPHAFVVVTDDGRGVLVHLGIDTVDLKGEGFELLASEGTTVAVGDPVVRWDPAGVEAGGRSPACPVVALDAVADDVQLPAVDEVVASAELFSWR